MKEALAVLPRGLVQEGLRKIADKFSSPSAVGQGFKRSSLNLCLSGYEGEHSPQGPYSAHFYLQAIHVSLVW
ncbi:MAG: hypothetical protein P8074_14400 [Anaerolineales bacterium]